MGDIDRVRRAVKAANGDVFDGIEGLSPGDNAVNVHVTSGEITKHLPKKVGDITVNYLVTGGDPGYGEIPEGDEE